MSNKEIKPPNRRCKRNDDDMLIYVLITVRQVLGSCVGYCSKGDIMEYLASQQRNIKNIKKCFCYDGMSHFYETECQFLPGFIDKDYTETAQHFTHYDIDLQYQMNNMT